MVQNDIHRPHVFLLGERKIKDAGWFLRSLLAVVQGCGRKIFFACSGNGNGSSWNNRGGNGNYWSASFNSARNARNLNFNSGGVNPQNNNNRYNGFAVRPVQHTILVIILFSMIYGTDTSATITRSIPGILRCEEAQVETLLRQGVGEESETEHGRPMRRPVLQTIQAPAFEMLHRGLSEEEGDIRCHVSGPYSTPSILQLYSLALREDVHPRHVQLHQESRHPLWHRPNNGLLSERVEKLATEVLCDALRHQGLLYAHCTEEALGDRRWIAEEDGYAQGGRLWHNRMLDEDLGRGFGYGLLDMADGSDRDARPEGELHHSGIAGRLDRTRPCQVDAPLDGRTWTAYRQPDFTVILECLSERVRPVYEARPEMSLLWPLRGRCSDSLCRQGMAIVACTEDQGVPAQGVGLGPAYGQIGSLGSASRRGVLRSLHQALQDVYQQSRITEDEVEDFAVRLLEALESASLGEQLPRHIQAYCLVQVVEKTIDDERDTSHRHIQRGYVKVYRPFTIL